MRTEDSGIRMNRQMIAFAMITLILAVAVSGSAGAERTDPATPTDLSCLHEHTRTTIYFFDSPVYTPIDAETHKVFGPATVETVCEDCGELLSAETVDNAEEIRPHSMKKGVCALCGYREPVDADESQPEEDAGEEPIIAQEDGSAAGLMSMILSEAELAELADKGISTVVVRGRDGSTAVVLNVQEALSRTKEAGADLALEIAEQEDGSVFVGLYLVFASGERIPADCGGVTIRLYREEKAGERVSVAAPDSEMLKETRGVWDDRGFWSVPYLEEGTYFILQ